MSGNHAADNLVLKDKGFFTAKRQWFDLQPNIAKLSMSAALPLVTPIGTGLFADRLTVGDTWFAYLEVHAIFAFDALDNDLNMRFAHTGEQHFGGLWITCDTQCAVFFYDTCQCIAHFIQVGFTLGEDGYSIHRLREVDRFQGSSCIFTASKSISSMSIGKFSYCPEITGRNLCRVFLHFAALDDQLSNTLIGLCLHVKDMAI